MKTIKIIMDAPKDLYAMWMARGLSLGTPLNEVLDKIRAEIQAMPTDYCGGYIGLDKQEVLKIINKYREEQE